MAMTMHVDIVSLEKQIFSGRASAVFVTGILGELGIYPGHAPLLSSLKPGEIRIQADNKEELYYVSGGILEVQSQSVSILADTVIRATDIDEAKALVVKEQAEKVLAGKQSELEYTKAAAELAQAIAQLRALQKIRKKYKI
jgi:F-type H+-transporting ATPase subunit epsilon